MISFQVRGCVLKLGPVRIKEWKPRVGGSGGPVTLFTSEPWFGTAANTVPLSSPVLVRLVFSEVPQLQVGLLRGVLTEEAWLSRDRAGNLICKTKPGGAVEYGCDGGILAVTCRVSGH